MSVLVKGMEMPKDCRECRLMEYHSNLGETWCAPAVGLLAVDFNPIPFDGRPDWCPLVELPEKHGRLIDADELFDKMRCSNWSVSFYHDGTFLDISEFADIIRNIETVIEAEGEE